MLTGDNRTTAEAVASGSALTMSKPVLPDQKSAVVARLKSEGAWWRWPATGSTTPPHWLPPMSVLPWARAPTSRSSAA
jgi:hypothetical protein